LGNGILATLARVASRALTPTPSFALGLLEPALEVFEQCLVAGALDFGLDAAILVRPRIALDALGGETHVALDMPLHGPPAGRQKDALYQEDQGAWKSLRNSQL
jgi:hypothetical protein